MYVPRGGNNYTCSLYIIFFYILNFILHLCFYPNMKPPPPCTYPPHDPLLWDTANYTYKI